MEECKQRRGELAWRGEYIEPFLLCEPDPVPSVKVIVGVEPVWHHLEGRAGQGGATAVDVDRFAVLSALHEDRLVVGVAGHLGEAVPDDGASRAHPSGCRWRRRSCGSLQADHEGSSTSGRSSRRGGYGEMTSGAG
ncbi:MAG: hypothetical protein ACYCS7_00985 [Acidimicrobiales bacterium]